MVPFRNAMADKHPHLTLIEGGGSPDQQNEVSLTTSRVRWYSPHPSDVYQVVSRTLEETGNKILAKALRDLGKCQAQEWVQPNTYSVPETPAVIEWLEQMRGDIDIAIHLLRTAPHEAPEILLRDLRDDFKTECEMCGKTFFPEKRNRAKFCSTACKQRAYRRRTKTTSPRKEQL